MLKLCAELEKANAAYENAEHGMGPEPSPVRAEVVRRWMWTAIMLLDSLGYDVVKPPARARKRRMSA